MAGRKVEVLEGELGQLKTDFEEKVSDFQNQFSTIHEKIDGRFAALEDLMKKMIEDKQKPATSETTGGHGRGGSPNPFRGRENPEVEVLEGNDGMPPLEPLSREEMCMGYDKRKADFVRRMEEFHCRGAEFEGRREEIQRRGADFEGRREEFHRPGADFKGRSGEYEEGSVEYKHLIGFPTDFSLFFLCWLLSTAENSSFLAVFPIRFGSFCVASLFVVSSLFTSGPNNFRLRN
ncbi:hypothetical protein M5K25_008486 [Dendrobium thyrsiflorum]|uniref:Uncharacterized protein n=1 Tax=Dendrobium thyrsiflorum TaxID=117978 RepID=A0ABD0V8T0_DENTH